MRKKIFSATFLVAFQIIFYGNLFAQTNYTKSTIEELQKLRGNVNVALEENDSLSIARACYKLALKYDYIDVYDSSDIYYKKAISLAKKLKNIRATAIISNALATSISERGFHAEAIEIYDQIVELFFSENDTTGASGVILNTAAEYIEMGQYQKALELSLQALDLKLDISDSTNIAAFYKQIAFIFNLAGNNQKWEEYIFRANSLAKKYERYGDFYVRMDILNQLGEYYFDNENYELSKQYYDTLYVESTKKDYLSGITAATSNLVPILKKQEKYSEALVLSKKALALAEKGEKPYQIVHNLVETSKLEIILSKKDIALRRLQRAKNLSIRYNFPDELISIYGILSQLYFEKGNYKLAFNNLLSHQTLRDSIEGKNTKQIIAELETKYQTEKKNIQIELLNKENLIKEDKITFQNRTVIGLILLGVLSLVLFILIYTQSKLKAQNRILNMHQQLLRSQMNPHFIFNALIAIQNYILKNKKFEASDYLAQFATLMRSILEGSRDDFILLSREIEILKYYVSLQQLRFENSFQFILDVDERIETERLQIPPMLIQPFIENAIEHGLSKISDEEKILTVKYILDNNSLNIFIEDNGIGIEKSFVNAEKKHQSYAMEITKERLTNITKIYKENIHIAIQDLAQYENRRGTQIRFEIPLKLITRDRND